MMRNALAVVLLAGCGRVDFEAVPGGVVLSFGDLGEDSARVIATTPRGTLLVGGLFRGSVDFGCEPVSSAGGADGFVLELTPQLACVHAWRAGGIGDDLVADLAVDGAGNIVIGGEFRLTAGIGPGGPALTAAFLRDVYLAKLTPAWQLAWLRQLPGNDQDPTYDILGRLRTDSSGGVHVFGRVWGSVQFGWDGVIEAFTDVGWGDAFVLQVTADGTYVKADTFGGGGSEHPYGMVVDEDDNLYLSGAYRGSADFDPGPATVVRGGNHDGFVERRNADGTLGWVNADENGAWRPYQALTTRPGGELVAVQNDLFTLAPAVVIRTLAYDRSDGSIVWSKDISGAVMYAEAITTDREGHVYVAGRFEGAVDFEPGPGEDLRTSLGANDCFVQRYDADGTYRWTMTFGGLGQDTIRGIVALAPDDVVVVGSFEDAVDFGTLQDPEIVEARGAGDVFVRRITR